MNLDKNIKTVLGMIAAVLLFRNKASGSVGPTHPGFYPANIDFRGEPFPRGIRNNNPGNLKYFNIGWQGEVGHDGVFSIFSMYKFGIRAMLKDLQNDYRNKGKTTLKQLINEFAPNSENPTSSYISTVSDWTGINPNIPFTDNYTNWKKIVIAMARFENGRDAIQPEMFDQVWIEFGF